jgi:AcrR family transcriptional regulator
MDPTECIAAPARRRRSGEEVRALILAAARAAFAEHGFAGATTREIANRAGTTEVLIFRHFGSKAALFEAAILTPFNQLLERFLDSQRVHGLDRRQANEAFVGPFYRFLRGHAELLSALVKSRVEALESKGQPGLADYFAKAARRLESQQARAGERSDVPPELGVRFAFGMIAATILFEDWFFEGDRPDDATIAVTLSRMLYRALGPDSPQS